MPPLPHDPLQSAAVAPRPHTTGALFQCISRPCHPDQHYSSKVPPHYDRRCLCRAADRPGEHDAEKGIGSARGSLDEQAAAHAAAAAGDGAPAAAARVSSDAVELDCALAQAESALAQAESAKQREPAAADDDDDEDEVRFSTGLTCPPWTTVNVTPATITAVHASQHLGCGCCADLRSYLRTIHVSWHTTADS